MAESFTFPSTPLPEVGLDPSEILAELAARKAGDRDWRSGRVFSLVYDAGPAHHDLLGEALRLYSAENGLNVLAFPSIGLLAHDLVEQAKTMLGGDDDVTGYLTSGGTESLLQAVKVARDVARDRGIERPNLVCATSAHAAFTKAGELFDVEVRRVPVRGDLRADVEAMEAHLDHATALLVGSAPSYPHGVIDPIEALGELALRHGTLLHVDACMGGYLLPYLTELGRCRTAFDLTVEGVTSISADTHKYGYASKGVSVVLYRTAALARHQLFMTSDWQGGFYASTTMAGSKPAGPIAAAWASVMHLGHQGFLDLAEMTADAAAALIAGINRIEGLEVLGEPDMTVLAFGTTDADLDIFAIAEELVARDWYLDRQRHPDSCHLTVHAGSVAAVQPFLLDLAEAVEVVRLGSRDGGRSDADAPYARDV